MIVLYYTIEHGKAVSGAEFEICQQGQTRTRICKPEPGPKPKLI